MIIRLAKPNDVRGKKNVVSESRILELREYLKEKDIHITGEQHTNQDFSGVPVFGNNTVMLLSENFWDDKIVNGNPLK